ncbi:MAG TPA: hypothetical protein PKD78_00365 [Saprospiraceae bacterium]|nr:hypothetical protein [Saprospiraceae bacterium]HNG88804.1 hypothetical protein [Saprospiraceae bacterium]
MRHYFFLLVLPLLLCFCKKDDNQVPTDPKPPVTVEPIIELGKASVLRNGKVYQGKMKSEYRNYGGTKAMGIYGSWFTQNGLVDEYFGIYDIPLAQGKYLIEPSLTVDNLGNGIPDGGIVWIVDTDQYTGDHILDTTRSRDHYIEVIRYDSLQHTLEGRFQVFFRCFSGNPPGLPGIPDTISFTQGKFHLKISN